MDPKSAALAHDENIIISYGGQAQSNYAIYVLRDLCARPAVTIRLRP